MLSSNSAFRCMCVQSVQLRSDFKRLPWMIFYLEHHHKSVGWTGMVSYCASGNPGNGPDSANPFSAMPGASWRCVLDLGNHIVRGTRHWARWHQDNLCEGPSLTRRDSSTTTTMLGARQSGAIPARTKGSRSERVTCKLRQSLTAPVSDTAATLHVGRRQQKA